MDFATLIKPLSTNEFAAKAGANESFVIFGKGERDFTDLLSLAEIETALNSGCNISSPINIITEDGLRAPVIDENVAWSTMALKKTEITKLLESGHSFMMPNMSQINESVANLIDDIEKTVDHSRADLHLYVSTSNDATGYMAHRDRPQHKIYLQVIGNTSWKLFSHTDDLPNEQVSIEEKDEDKYLTEIMDFTMEPGDVLFMPSGQIHKVRNHDGPRMSFSIPIFIDIDNTKHHMDRSHIPFQKLFEDAS